MRTVTRIERRADARMVEKMRQCDRCDGAGCLDGKDYPDGSSSTARPCPKCSGFVASD